MIADGLEFGAAELTEAQERAGLIAALAIFAAAGITPFEGAFARDLVQQHDEFTFGAASGDEDEEPVPPEEGGLLVPAEKYQAAYDIWEKAYDTALYAAGCAPGSVMITDLTFRALPPEMKISGRA